MINDIIAGPGLMSVSGSAPWVANNGAGAGIVRYNTNTQQMEVNDGQSWISIAQGSPSISLDNEAQELLAWARKKKSQEDEIEKLCEKHPGLLELKEKFEMMIGLVKTGE